MISRWVRIHQELKLRPKSAWAIFCLERKRKKHKYINISTKNQRFWYCKHNALRMMGHLVKHKQPTRWSVVTAMALGGSHQRNSHIYCLSRLIEPTKPPIPIAMPTLKGLVQSFTWPILCMKISFLLLPLILLPCEKKTLVSSESRMVKVLLNKDFHSQY